jgi:hypothetical protein
MKNILDKLKKMDIEKMEKSDNTDHWKNWTLEEKKKLLDIYILICKNERHIFNLVYSYQGCDGWEDIFRDYDEYFLQEKTSGVEMAINEINQMIEEK